MTSNTTADEALTAATPEALLTSYASLTHRLDAVQRDHMKPAERRQASATLRAQRDLVHAELLRRMGA